MQALAQAGYAFAGALVALLAGWVASLAFPQPHPGMLAHFVGAAAMAAALMLWAAFKPPCCKGGSTALQALLVVLAVMAVWAVGDLLSSPGMMEYFRNPLIWVWTYVFSLFNASLGFVLPAAWALGSSERWTRRPLRWVIGELVFAIVAGVLVVGRALDFLTTSLPGMAVYGLVSTAAVLAAAGVVQRLAWELAARIRARRSPA